MKITIIKNKNYLKGFSSSFELAEERISKLQNRLLESMESEEQEKKCWKMNKASEICRILLRAQTYAQWNVKEKREKGIQYTKI